MRSLCLQKIAAPAYALFLSLSLAGCSPGPRDDADGGRTAFGVQNSQAIAVYLVGQTPQAGMHWIAQETDLSDFLSTTSRVIDPSFPPNLEKVRVIRRYESGKSVRVLNVREAQQSGQNIFTLRSNDTIVL